ncbi:MAG: AmmeMemoRadiSam system radical SAM enzyme [Desulfuromonadaceae bacterium]|nr:AmmeMemoRadiSam system radical SAM enzyme [Desulfuromonadaceae bacterium]MDD2856707.1 AmmeMemoRadiSam system radical SAM enzyme [Desulfuromonadaceae bacterium]
MKEAMFYECLTEKRVKCTLCRFNCIIKEGSRGLCSVRENRAGTLYTLVYGIICAEHIDPIEKKPLFHVTPGSKSYSIATFGCNFHCRHCQNYSISQIGRNDQIRGVKRTSEQIIEQAVGNNCKSISYTYTEPTVFFEFAYDTARIARDAGLKNIFVTNGYISREALAVIAPFLDAANIDLKGFSDIFYRDTVGADLSELLDSIIEYRKHGIWLEITTLIIPGLNDSEEQLKGVAEFITANLGVDTPWHVTQFHPAYRITDRNPTKMSTLCKARDIGLAAGLRYVYLGNMPGEGGENTNCPECRSTLIKRHGFMIESNLISRGSCPDCNALIAGVGL